MIELTAVATVAARIAPKLTDFCQRRHRLLAGLDRDIKHIQQESSMIAAAIEDDGKHPHSTVAAQAHEQWIKIVRDLAYDIDDCIDRFIHRVSTAPVTNGGWVRRKAHRLKTLRARGKFAAAIVRLRKQSEDASELRKKYTDLAYGQGVCSSAVSVPCAPEVEPEMYTDIPVGMDAPEEELRELIRQTPQVQPNRLKVISIVGFDGIGKSQLAKRVYDTLDECQYPARAWVRAAEKGPEDLLQAILQELGMDTTTVSASEASSSNSKLCATIKKLLGTQRFFIVIDDMREDFWINIKDAFPMVPGVNSRVLVTTARQTIAIKSSSRDGHVYVMRTLADDHSRQLFCEKASLVYPPTDGDTKMSSEVIKRCDGLPLALVTTARLLHGESRPEQWADLGGNLGEHLENNKKLASMNAVLVRSYTSLSKQHIKTCLLYLGIYPSGRPIRRGSLIRRWSAEGLIAAEHKRSAREVALANFNELVDWSIIQPVDASSSSRAEVKACQTHGIMLEFLLHKSMCENFVTLLYDDVPPPSKVRWLSLHNESAPSSRINPNYVPFLRSLTIFGKAHKSILSFSKYKLMRVLDLEECHEELEDKHLKGICSNLLLLRYLSLRGASKITILPKEVKKLRLLETLDVRGTHIDILPTRVMQLPCLLHLFGKFKLPQGVGGRKMRKLHTWLENEENSKLQTAAGFVVDNKSHGFAQVMGKMKKLTKVKIWCESTTDDSSYLSHVSKTIKGFTRRGTDSSDNLSNLSEAIKEFIERGINKNKARSLSLNMNGAWSQNLLNFSLDNNSSCYLSSLKLQGNNISSLPQFVTKIGGLTKLCLSFSHLQLSRDILGDLNNVSGLEYLKLNATRLDDLVIREGELRSLKGVCIVVEVMNGLVVEEGALPDLESLQLICKNLNGFSGTTIQSFPRLKEVAIHDEVSKETKEEWEEATRNHSRHPKLLFLTKQIVDDHFKPMRSEAAVEISPAGIANDTMVVESEPAETAEPIDTMLSMITPPKAISTGESVQLNGGCQHNDDGGKDLDNIEDPKDFATKNGLRAQVIDQTSKGSYKVKVEGVACFVDRHMEDSAQEVAFQDGVSNETKYEWKEAAKNHPRCPKLLFVQSKPMESEPAMEISHVAQTADMMGEEVGAESESVENSKSPTAPLTDTTLQVTTPLDAISTRKCVQVVTSEEEDQEISPGATGIDTMIDEIDVESKPAENSESPVALPTGTILSRTMPSDVISTGESVQLNGGCQHGDDGKDVDNIEDPKDIARKNGRITQVIDPMNKESIKEEVEGVAGLEDLHMEDGTQKRGIQNKQRRKLVKIGVFRQRSRQRRLMPRPG